MPHQLMNEWNIQSRSHHCQSCQNAFAAKQVYHTVLLDEKREFKRLDLCKTCWEKEFSGQVAEMKNVISQWQGVYEPPPAAPPEAIQKETAETLLRKLVELGEPKYQAACYILSAMLERKRLLKVKEQTRREGKRIFLYEHPKSGDLFTIVDPDLQLTQLEEVQRDVAHLLEHGLPGVEPAAADPATTAASTNDSTPGPGNVAEEPVSESPSPVQEDSKSAD
jgi:hypothetical protein